MADAIQFHKMNGLGNEIVVVDLRDRCRVFSPAEVRAIAAAQHSGFDQMMVLQAPRTPGCEAYVRIYNRDGSEVEACGNGMRCVGFLAARQTGRRAFAYETKAGVREVDVEGVDRISVDMGTPKFGWAEIPLAGPVDDTLQMALQLGPSDAQQLHAPSVVNVGNPHAVFWVADVGACDLGRVGPMLENHPIFPERANISLAHVTSPTAITLRTWERGAGLTRACGSAACAAAVCAARKGLTERRVTITVPGGVLEITWRADDHILMTGPVAIERVGVLAGLAVAG
jgi:diaminopimelate epimerase